MNEKDVRELFVSNSALLSGHFVLSSGLHSDTYFQSALVLQDPKVGEQVAVALAQKLSDNDIKVDLVVSPALGGIIIGQEMARVLGTKGIFTEKDKDGKTVLRRGFSINKGQKVLIVEDVITTGLSTKEVMETIKPLGADVVAVVSLVDRSEGKVDLGVPRFSLLSLNVKSFKADECAMCKTGSVAIKPGSRR